MRRRDRIAERFIDEPYAAIGRAWMKKHLGKPDHDTVCSCLQTSFNRFAPDDPDEDESPDSIEEYYAAAEELSHAFEQVRPGVWLRAEYMRRGE